MDIIEFINNIRLNDSKTFELLRKINKSTYFYMYLKILSLDLSYIEIKNNITINLFDKIIIYDDTINYLIYVNVFDKILPIYYNNESNNLYCVDVEQNVLSI